MELLNQRKSYSIDELAAILSESHNMIKYNVEKMIKENFFEYVYMDDNTSRLINTIFGEEEQTYSKMKWETVEATTSESDAEEAETFDVVEEEEPVVKSDRMIQIVCMNCGAPNKVYSNSTAECMYCGSIIN
jgi:ribosomal protein S27E